MTNNRKPSQLPQASRRHTSERSSEENEDQVLSTSRSTRDSQRLQWHLRQRESSDQSTQPHSAPSGLAAQQSENFQRFYRAVVSPTHVRVTAGGRIVPNTRAIAPPAFDWNGEKLISEPGKPLPDIEPSNSQSIPWIHSNPLPTGFPPSIPSDFLPPYNFLSQDNSLPHTTMVSNSINGVSGQNSFESVQDSKTSGDVAQGPIQSGSLIQQIKISPPSQFDHSKPFIYNGQWVYPVPPGFQPPPNALPLPIAMLGNPNLVPQLSPPLGNFHTPHIAAHMAVLSNPLMPPPPHVQPLPLMMHNGAQIPENLLPVAHLQIPGMISVSDITKSQIQGLRTYLKFIDHQVANNKHQIDEKYMETQRNATLGQIHKMEAILASQLAQENRANVATHEESQKSDPQRQYMTINDGGMADKTPGRAVLVKVPGGFQEVSASDAPLKQTSKSEDFQAGKPGASLRNPKSSSRSEPTSRSRLSAAAAMAPPFQPRAQAVVVKPSQTQPAKGIARPSRSSTTPPNSSETQEGNEARLLSKSASDWGTSTSITTAPGVGPRSLLQTQSMHEASVQNQSSNQPPAFQRFDTFPGQDLGLPSQAAIPTISPPAIPYLVGVLPQNMQVSDAKATDLIYPRPLTEEEVHARVLYWGKAPRPAQSGLPKFDGKDFYPPSPVKGVARLALNIDHLSPAPIAQSAMAALEFGNLFTEPGVLGYKTPSPLHPRMSLQNLVPAPFLENEIPQQPVYASESFTFHDWSAQNLNAVKHTTLTPTSINATTRTGSSQDFSKLFMERGVAGYKSPFPTRLETTQPKVLFDNGKDKTPVTPENAAFPDETEGGDDETRTLDSWGAPTTAVGWIPEESDVVTPIDPEANDLQSNASTVEIHLTPKTKDGSSNDSSQISFAERVAKFSR